MKTETVARGLGLSVVLGLSLTSACVEAPDGAMEEDGTAVSEINGASSPASQFQLDRAARLPGCSATRIYGNFAITARHCGSAVGDLVKFYTTGPTPNPALTARVEQVIGRPGTSASVCFSDMNGCVDSSGNFADVALLRLSTDASGGVDALGGVQATLGWTYPGNHVLGTQVGNGQHSGSQNTAGVLLQVNDTTDNASDGGGYFETDTDFVDPGDSGGPFYVAGKTIGTLWGHGWNPLDGNFTRYTSIPFHLDWILSTIGYHWIGQPPQLNLAYTGSTIESLVTSQQICQYACEKTSSCQAYNYMLTSSTCSLVTNVTGTTSSAPVISALRFGASSGKSNEVVGYVRSDGVSAVVHKGTNGSLHELVPSGASWTSSAFAPAGMQTIAGKLSAYRRADGINAIVYRSTTNRIVEVARVNGVWKAFDLTLAGGALPAGDPTAYIRADGVSAVVFRSANGHINELRLGTLGWLPTDLTAAAGSTIVASSDPSAFVRSDGRSSVTFRAGTDIIELFKSANQQWAIGGPSSLAGAPAATSRPYGYNHHDGTTAIVYRSTANRLIELFLDGAGWHFGDITKTGGSVAGDPVAYVRTDALEAVLYRSSANEITEVANIPWQSFNLTQKFGAGSATTDPAVFHRADGFNSVLYGLANNHVGELSLHIGTNWNVDDLTISGGEVP